MVLRLAICGKMGSGKTTLANHIKKENPFFVKRSLAEGVKKFARFVYDIPEGKKDRVLFQKIGDGARQELFEDVWITTLLRSCDEGEHTIVDDVRYHNEVIKLKELGWKIIKIDIENKLQEERIKKTYPNDWKIHLASRTHNSEIEIDSIPENLFDIIIKAENNNQPQNELNQYLYNLYLEEWCMNTL